MIAQAKELVDSAQPKPSMAIIGGDTNAPLFFFDQIFATARDGVTQTFLRNGFYDAHASLKYVERITHQPGLILDLIFGDQDRFRNPAVCAYEVCGGLSDHMPVWVDLDLRDVR